MNNLPVCAILAQFRQFKTHNIVQFFGPACGSAAVVGKMYSLKLEDGSYAPWRERVKVGYRWRKKELIPPLNQRNRVDSHWTCSLRSLFGAIDYDEDEGASPLTPNQSITFPLNLLASLAIWRDPRNHNEWTWGGQAPLTPPPRSSIPG